MHRILIILSIQFGELLGFLETGGDVKGLIDFLDSDEIIRIRLAIYPWLTSLFEKFIPIYQKLMTSVHGTSGLAFQQFADGKIESDRQAQLGGQEIGSGPVYMVRRFLEKQQGDPDKGMTDWDVAANAVSYLVTFIRRHTCDGIPAGLKVETITLGTENPLRIATYP